MYKININTVFFSLICSSGFLFSTNVWANCTAKMEDINFGEIDAIQTNNIVSTHSVLQVTCENHTKPAARYHICLAVDGGSSAHPHQLNPRQICEDGMCNHIDSTKKLNFNLYTDASHNQILGVPNNGSIIQDTINVPPNQSVTKTYPIYGKILKPFTQNKAGIYLNHFHGNSATLHFTSASNNAIQPNACLLNDKKNHFDFTAKVKINKNCLISELNNLDFGKIYGNQTNIQGKTTFNITCTNQTPYHLGLMPSNNNPDGQGEMKAIDPRNSDKIIYQLRSESGIHGKIWGNKINADYVGNGVHGMGTGQTKQHTIYATMPSADYPVGEYRDTVTIFVKY